MICPNCGKQNDNIAKYCQSCGVALQSAPTAPTLVTSIKPVETVIYAGFWARFVAIVIDTCIIALASGIATAGTFGVGVVVTFLLHGSMKPSCSVRNGKLPLENVRCRLS